MPQPFFVLAPMEAVTDTAFRHAVAQAAPPDVWFSEFVNATGWVAAGDKAVGTRLAKTDDEKPIVAQIWGAKPEAIGQLASHCRDLGYDGVDINTGCPDPVAVKSGSGSALIKDPSLTTEIVQAARSCGLPVSVKTRLGYSRLDEWQPWIQHLLELKLPALTVHLRTKKEMSKVAAHWEIMPQVIAMRDEISPSTIIIGNGDVADRQQGTQLAERTGCEGIMIGRGVFRNPFCFEMQPSRHGRDELLELLHTQLDWHDKLAAQNPERKFDPLKHFFKIYIRDFPGASELRDALMHASSTDEVRQLLASRVI